MNGFEEFDIQKKSTVYRKWAYKVFIYMFWLNILIAFMVGRGNYHPWVITGTSLLATILLIAGILLIIISIKNKEEKNYQYHVSIWGYTIFLILTVISIFSEIDLFN